MAEPLLSLDDLAVHFKIGNALGGGIKTLKAVDGVDLDIRQGEVLGLVGESGSGKSVTALSILRLIPDPPGKIVSGEIIFDGTDLVIGHVERYWCPTITSTDLTGRPPFRFQEDTRPTRAADVPGVRPCVGGQPPDASQV